MLMSAKSETREPRTMSEVIDPERCDDDIVANVLGSTQFKDADAIELESMKNSFMKFYRPLLVLFSEEGKDASILRSVAGAAEELLRRIQLLKDRRSAAIAEGLPAPPLPASPGPLFVRLQLVDGVRPYLPYGQEKMFEKVAKIVFNYHKPEEFVCFIGTVLTNENNYKKSRKHEQDAILPAFRAAMESSIRDRADLPEEKISFDVRKLEIFEYECRPESDWGWRAATEEEISRMGNAAVMIEAW